LINIIFFHKKHRQFFDMKGTHMVQNSEDKLYFIAYLVRLNEEHDLNFPLQPLE